jgi:hypothetical protein
MTAFVVPSPAVLFAIAEVKASVETRLSTGAKIGSVGPTSPLYTKQPEIHAGIDGVAVETTALKTLFDNCSTAQANYLKARTALGTGIFNWDASFDMLVAAGDKFCVSEDDAAKLALPTRARVKNQLAVPLGVDLTHDAKNALVRVRVRRAPGMKVVRVEWTTDLNAPGGWHEFDGCGALHVLKSPAPGTYWVRACSKTAAAKSDYTSPVCVIVP